MVVLSFTIFFYAITLWENTLVVKHGVEDSLSIRGEPWTDNRLVEDAGNAITIALIFFDKLGFVRKILKIRCGIHKGLKNIKTT